MWVYFGPIANASKSSALLLDPGQVLNCSNSGVSATDQVSITGTSTGVFFASQDGSPTVSGPAGGTGGGGVTTNVNVTAVGGNAVTTSLPVSNVAGSAIIGQVGIDQTTPGTTNGVVATGNVASGATDSGNPVKIGGRFNSTLPTLTDGQRGDLQQAARGSLLVTLQSGANALSVVGAGADALSNTFNSYTQNSLNSVFNGTTWDRQRPGPYQLSQTPITAAATGTTGAVTATLAALASNFTYICGFDISATGGVATLGPITITNVGGNTFTYQLFSTATGAQLQKTFSPCIRSSAVNTAIAVATTADGTATAVDVNTWGFQGP